MTNAQNLANAFTELNTRMIESDQEFTAAKINSVKDALASQPKETT